MFIVFFGETLVLQALTKYLYNDEIKRTFFRHFLYKN